MTNKEQIFNKIKEVVLKVDSSLAWGYSQLVPCYMCVFKKECEKEVEERDVYECAEKIKKKLKEDEEQ